MNILQKRAMEAGRLRMANQKIIDSFPKVDPIGVRFASAEARIAELEETLDIMRDMLNKNNQSLAEILRAVAGQTQ